MSGTYAVFLAIAFLVGMSAGAMLMAAALLAGAVRAVKARQDALDVALRDRR